MKFWVCVNNEIFGPLEPADAVKVPGFTLFAWACRDMPGGGRSDEPRAWKRAISFPEMAACFFPNYPPPAAIPESPAPEAAPPPSGPAPAAPAVPPGPPPQRMALEPDSALMREINRKLDDLLARRGAAPPPAAADPLVKELRRTEVVMAKLASGSGQALHKELEPLSRKLDLAEKAFSEMKSGLAKEALHLEIEPLTRTLAVTEKAVEDIRRDMESREIGGGLEPLKAELELAEKAIEAEDARIALFRQEVVARISALEASIKEFRVELAAGRAIAETEALMRQPPPQPPKRALLPALAAALAAGALLGALAFFRNAPSPAAVPPVQPAAAPVPVPAAKTPSELDFARAYRVSPGGLTLAAAIERDASGRGGTSGGASWEPEKVSDSYYRLLVSVPIVGGPGSLQYYFGLYPAEGRVRALNKAGRRALDLLAASGPEKL